MVTVWRYRPETRTSENYKIVAEEHRYCQQDPQLAQRIIDTELPGVFNWVLKGLRRLLKNCRFTESEIAQQQIDEYKLESDSVSMFISEEGYQPSATEYMTVGEFYGEYKDFCQADGYRALGKKNFTKRCRTLGLEIIKISKHGVCKSFRGMV